MGGKTLAPGPGNYDIGV